MITVVATIELQPGKGEEFIKEYRKAFPKVMKDPGARAYILHRDLKNADKFYFYEQYTDQKALDYHTSTPHFKEFFTTTGKFFAKPPIIEMCEEVK